MKTREDFLAEFVFQMERLAIVDKNRLPQIAEDMWADKSITGTPIQCAVEMIRRLNLKLIPITEIAV